MLSWLKHYLTAPAFEPDEEKSRVARVLNALQLALVAATLLAGLASVFVFAEKLGSLAIVAGMVVVLTLSRVLMYRGYVRSASILILTGLWCVATGMVLMAGGMNSIDAVYYLALTIISGLLLGSRAMIIVAGASSLAGLAMALNATWGHPLPQLFPVPPLSGWINFSLSLFLIVITSDIALRNLHNALALAQRRLEERRQAEREREQLLIRVQEQARQVQQVMDTVPEGVLLLDNAGRVLSANRLGQQDLSTLAGSDVGDVLTQLGGCPLADLLAAPPRGLWHELETETRSLQVLAKSIRHDEQPEGWVLVVRDVTQQRETAQRAQQQERLAAVGQLAAGIAHDFNNIMATIVLYSQMSARVAGVPAAVQERLTTIYQQAMYATRLIQQILDFSRRTILERHPFDLLALVEEQIKLLERTLPENIHLMLTHDDDNYTLNGSATSMQQVVMNLAVNARDAMPNGGALHFHLTRLHVDTANAALLGLDVGEWIQLTVTDTGNGIPPDVLPHIFEPFFTTKEPGQGTGLGLSQVYGIIGMHGGQIHVDSRPGKGTTFSLHLPALETTAGEGITGDHDRGLITGQGQMILVVEDNPVTRMALVDSLEALEYRAVAAENGRYALAMLEAHPDEIALVLSDVVMPEMGGLGLIEAMRQRGIHTRVVLLTGHPLKEDWTHMEVDWLLKPLTLEALARVIAQALAKS
ncbi:MAG TPA: ATP-binding protein [Anaerolineae bacterium]|nr:ATP-binding protein [Anaerolineae bacterium]HQH37333.1 ATP-binding protein [Anaerolineae bacterium]